MKRTIISILLAVITMTSMAQIKPEVSETVELMSILSRTSGLQEYRMDMGGLYTKDTEEWFSPHKEHPLVGYYQALRAKYGIGHDAVMTMAINIAAENGTFYYRSKRPGTTITVLAEESYNHTTLPSCKTE